MVPTPQYDRYTSSDKVDEEQTTNGKKEQDRPSGNNHTDSFNGSCRSPAQRCGRGIELIGLGWQDHLALLTSLGYTFSLGKNIFLSKISRNEIEGQIF